MAPAIALDRVFAYAGPNIYGPDPGVLLRVRSARDRSARLRAALKDGAQFIGLVIAYLEATARPDGDGCLISASFVTDAPELGAALAQYVVAGLVAEASGDEEWDRDGPLLELRERRAREALPVAALRIFAEARRRRLPAFLAADGTAQLGYGIRNWRFDPAASIEEQAGFEPPWEHIGHVPIIAVTGGSGRARAVQHFAAELAALGPNVRALESADFDQARAALSASSTEALVVGLDSGAILRRGVPFDRCTLAVITDRDGPQPAEAADEEAWLRALGVPMLLAEQPARLNLADQRLRGLVPYAPNGVIAL